MQCFIYRSSVREGLYVYLAEEDGLERLPEAVRKQLGEAEFAMSIEITPERELGQENVVDVLDNLERRGYHLQMPRDIESVLADIARQTFEANRS